MTGKEKVYGYICHKSYKPLTADELRVMLDVPPSACGEFYRVVDELLTEGKIIQSKKGRLKKSPQQKNIYGTVSLMKSGSAFVTPINSDTDVNISENTEDIFVDRNDMNFAFDGDTVSVKLTRMPKPGSGKKREGIITKVIHRASDTTVGTIDAKGTRLFIPDTQPQYAAHISKDSIYVSDNQKAVAKIVRYPDHDRPMKVRIIKLLGNAGDISTLISCAVHENKIPVDFSAASLNQAKSLDFEVSETDTRERADFRGDRVITIDGEDSRDLDDAVCVKKHPDSTFTLYVHIADVSHYVGENTAIDLDALERATSVYLPDRVIPMLPRELSNGICSLNEGEDRLTLSVTMHIGSDGNVIDYKIEEGIICSLHRMTYTAVTAMLENDADMLQKYSDIADDVKNMRELAMILKKRRRAMGSIDFNFPEPKVILDSDGRVAGIKAYETGISNEIIEQFMLIANETVAKHASDNALPFVYRVHESPDGEKLANLQKYLRIFGIPFKIPDDGKICPRDIQRVMDMIAGTPEEHAASTLCLRSMMKAQYAPENLGHFGIGAKYYCHFTSPIRRYPDLAIHRILKESIKKGISEKRRSYLDSFTERASAKSCEAEVRAVEAERSADKICMCAYMQQFIGEEFDAIISSVTDFGLFVEVCGCIEGLVPMAQLCDDYYEYDEEFMCLRGRSGGKIFSLGDSLTVRLTLSSPQQRLIDFEIVGMEKHFAHTKAHENKKSSGKKQDNKKQYGKKQYSKNQYFSGKQRKKSAAKNQFKKFVKKKSKHK